MEHCEARLNMERATARGGPNQPLQATAKSGPRLSGTTLDEVTDVMELGVRSGEEAWGIL